MAKPKRRYVCQACGSVTHRWQGQCADCGEWISAPPALSGGRVYVGDRSGRLHTFDVQTGAPLFRHRFSGKIAAAPLLLPEGVLVVTDKGEIALLGT